MPKGRPPAKIDPIRMMLAEQFKGQVARMESSKAELAARWRIDLRMLYRYLNGSAVPTFEVFGRLAAMPELELTVANKRMRTQDLVRPKRPVGNQTLQLDLDYEQEAVLRVGGQDIAVSFSRKPDGRVVVSVGLAQSA